VRPGGIASLFQHRRNTLGGLLESYVNDCAPWSTVTEAIQQQPVAIGLENRCGADLEIRPVKAGDDCTLFRNSESRTDVFDDRWSRRCCQRQDAFRLQLSGDCCEL